MANSDTPELDEKNKQNQSLGKSTNSIVKNILSFLISLLIIFLFIIGYFVFSSIILYECKLAQSNIVPTNLDCHPYTEVYPEIEKILTNIFITNEEPQESVKLSFEYDKYNSKNMVLEMFRKYKENPQTNFLIIYIISILEDLFNYSNNALTGYFNFLNGIPEILIVLLSPIFTSIYFVLAPLIGVIVFIYYYFAEMKWFFRKNANVNNDKGGTNKSNWTDITFSEPYNYGIALFLVFVFFLVFWVVLFTAAPFLPAFIFFICLFMTFGYKFEYDDKKSNILTIIQEIFKHYKVTITIVFTIMIVLNAFSTLGMIPGIFSLIIILLIAFKFIKINIFEPIKATNLSPLTSFDQAVKKCTGSSKTSPSFLNNIENLFGMKKGGGIGKELKKLHKKMTSK
jgi:flagellar basal body-associated protein FliL